VTYAPRPTQLEGADTRSLSGKSTTRIPAVLWGLACVLVWALAWVIGVRWRRWTTYALASPIMLLCLFFFFQNFARFVPANL
jgi:drug/metabolite transporter (DMT)-like permease